MNVIDRWRAWRAGRRHQLRLRLWLWHKHHRPGPCRCKKRIEKLTPHPKEINMPLKPTDRTPETLRAALAVTCPACGVTAGNRCRKGVSSRPPHDARIKAGTDG